MDEKLNKDYLATIGVDVTTVKISLNNNELITLTVWDLAGQDRFQKIRGQFYLGSVLGLLIFDVTNKESFMNLNNWIEEAESSLVKTIPLFLIGNKIDLPKRIVSKVEMEDFKKKNNLIKAIYETSALTGEGIKNLFHSSAEFIYNQYVAENPLIVNKHIPLKKETVTSKSPKEIGKKLPKKSKKKAIKKSSKKSSKKTETKTTKKSKKKDK